MGNIAEMFEKGRQASQEDRKQKTLRDFLQPALSGDKDALGQVFSAAPEMGMQVQSWQAQQAKAQQDQAESARENFGKLSVAMSQMKGTPQAQQVFTQWMQAGKAAGLLPAEAPDQYDPEAHVAAEHFARAFGGMQDNTPADIRSLQMLQQNPELMALYERKARAGWKPEIEASDDGRLYGVDPATLSARPVDFGGATQAGGPTGGASQLLEGSLQDAIAPVIAPLGGRITSTTGGQHNPGSLHYSGDAIDIGMARETPEQQAQLLAALGQVPGIRVRDERQRPPGQAVWSGPHLHVERARPGGQPTFGKKQQKAEGSYQTLSPQEIKQLGLPAGTVAQRSPSGQIQVINKPLDRGAGQTVVENPDGTTTVIPAGNPTEGERKSATLLKRMEGSLSQLQAALKADPDAASPSVMASIAGSLPFVGNVARNNVNSSERQRVEAAQLDILDAALTLGTGAAYTREQLEGYRSAYFPQLGDTQDTIKDKQARLNNVIQAARVAAGRAIPRPSSAPAKPASPANKFAGFKVLD